MNKNVNKKVLYVLPLLLWSACQAQSPQATQAPAEANPDRSAANSDSQNNAATPFQTNTRTYPALQKHPASGQIQLKANQLVLSLELYPEANETSENKANHATDFQTQRLNLSTATQLQATVTDSHGKTYQPNGADGNGAINYSGGTITLTFNNLVPDELLLVEVQARNGTTDIVQADLAAVLKHTTAASTPNSTINFQTTVAAKAMKALIANDAERARSIDLNALNTLTTAITGVSGSAPNFSYPQKHPALVNTTLLATDLQAQNPGDLSAANYRNLQGATINLNVTGLNGGDKLQVQINDAASAVQTNLGNGTTVITGVATGGPIGVSASAFGTPTQNYTYTVSPATFTPTEGNTLNLTVTAAPALNISGFSPDSGPAGTSVTLNGTGFTGATAVSFGGASASFTVDSDTQITVTVPANAVDGVISVTNGSTANSANSFDVHRRIYVNDDASGSNNGTSWSNAYTSLLTALAAAGANDEIWIAAGTYTPHASDRDVAFVMKENVNIYGGFAGTENALGDRTPSLTDFVTVLSGDLQNNDNYTTPGTTLDENSYHVVEGANNALLEGVTIQGGKADGSSFNGAGGGMYNTSLSPTLTHVTFTNNTADFGGGMYNSSSSPTLTHVTFSDNSAAGSGGGMYNDSSSPTLTHISFSDNSAASNGGGMHNYYSSPILTQVTFANNTASRGGGMDNSGTSSSPTLTHVTFSDNSASGSGGGMSNLLSSPTLTHVAFSNNSAAGSGGGMNNSGSLSSPTLTHVTFSDNTASGSGGGIRNLGSSPVLTNTLFYNSTRDDQPLGTNGNIDVGSTDPFIDSANPNGPDGIPRTADDGLRIAPTATAVINQGVTGPEVPATDILGNARISNPEPGAYEYITPPLPANVLVVKGNATGNNDGSSWANAFTNLQSALAAANGTTTTEIWIAEGQYTPAPSNGDRNLSFVMKDNVSLYGGFVGTETQRTERDPLTHTVTLSGDLNGNDNYSVQPFGNIAENSYTVIRGANNAVLDGVTIEGGNSDAAVVVADAPDIVGGGMINDGTSPTLNQVIFTHNSAVSRGGAMFNVNLSNPMMTHMRFIQNVSEGQGGALFNLDASPQITVGAFIGNTAASGGGMYTRTISGIVGNANAVLKNVIFSGNTATNRGGGMYSANYATPELINVTFSNNTATNDAGAFYDVTSSTTTSLKNVLFWNSTRRSSPVIPLDPSAGNVDAASNPFVNASDIAGPDGQYFTADDGLRLTASASDVLNMGTNIDIPSTDIIGNARPGSSNTNAEPGAYEYTP